MDPAGLQPSDPAFEASADRTGPAAGPPISSIDVTSILVVVDLANAAPGRAGVLRVLV